MTPAIAQRAAERAQHGLCVLHGGPLVEPTWEHLIPQLRGGNEWPINLALSCKRCNHERGPAPLTEEQRARVLAWFGYRKYRHVIRRDRLLRKAVNAGRAGAQEEA